MKNYILIITIIFFISCNNEEIKNPQKIYGLSYPSFNLVYYTEPDSIVEFDISNGKHKSLWPVNKFEGLALSQTYVSSKNLDILIYLINPNDLGFIDLKTGGFNRISFSDDSTHIYIGALEVDEKTDILMSIFTYYDYTSREYSLGIDEINLRTFEIVKSHKLIKKSSERMLLSDMDPVSKNIYIISPFSKTLFIYNYSTGDVIERNIDVRFNDIHYFNNKLIGTSDFSLVSYSIDSNVVTTISKYNELALVYLESYFFDKKNESYWIGTNNSENIHLVDFVNINLNNATINKRINMDKPVFKLN
ncbi:MAG: hypothetical protein PHS84_00220 [Paludibacter sp.]|nr:hypothetical protein [Paludibacter sp.]